MARFFYVAQDKNNLLSKGVFETDNRDEALKALLQKGLRPIKLDALTPEEKIDTKSGVAKVRIPRLLKANLGTFDQLIIIRHLGIILSTGTDILSALDILAHDAIKPAVKEILYNIKSRVSRGEKLSDALNAWHNQFNPVLISLVKSGELSGNLPSVLLSYAQELRKDYTFIRKLRGAIFYPTILIVALTAMIILILTVVTPRLKELFSSLKATPPFYTRIFFAASDFWLAHSVLIIITALVVGFGLFIALRKRSVRLRLLTALQYIPYINRIQRNITLMRFSRTVANLIHAGFSLKAALATTSDIVDLKFGKVLKDIADQSLEHGISMTEAMKKYPNAFPTILVSAVATGEKSGQLNVVLSQMSEFYEEDVIYSLETFLTLLEPVLLVIVGVIVGLLASSIIAPVYKLISTVH